MSAEPRGLIKTRSPVDLFGYLDVLRRRWVSVTIIALATIAVAAAASLTMATEYTAKTRLLFSVDTTTASGSDLAQGTNFAERQMSSYAEVATSPLVLDPVIGQLGLTGSAATLASKVTATVPPDTLILEISAVDSDRQRTAQIANAVGEELRRAVDRLSPKRTTTENGKKEETAVVQAEIFDPALAPGRPSSPNVPRNLALAVALGLLLGVGVALLRQLLDTRVRSEQDIRMVTDRPLLGAIGYDDKVPDHPLILRDEPLSAAAEAVRRLRTNLQFTDVGDRPRSIVITSSVPGEGKSTTSLNLAVALADAGSRVILVDADLRRPSVASSLGLEGQVGLTTVLIGRAKLDDVVQHWERSSLDILPSGRIPPNPSELLGSGAMEKLLDELTLRYDVVLLDSPPLLPVTDAAVLTKLAGGALVVAGANRVHRPQLQETMNALVTAGAYVHGVVLNRMARQETGAYTYYAGYAPTESSSSQHQDSADTLIQSAVATPKRARHEVSTPSGSVRVPATAPRTMPEHQVNGAEPPRLSRATPVGR